MFWDVEKERAGVPAPGQTQGEVSKIRESDERFDQGRVVSSAEPVADSDGLDLRKDLFEDLFEGETVPVKGIESQVDERGQRRRREKVMTGCNVASEGCVSVEHEAAKARKANV